MVEAPVQTPRVEILHGFEGLIDVLADILEPVRTQDGNERQGKKQRTEQGERHGIRHRMEKLSGSAAEGVNGNVTGDDDRDRIENGAVHIGSRRENHFIQLVILSPAQAQFAINVLDHDQGAVDYDPKVYGANGKQIGVHSIGMQAEKRKKEREGNRESDDHRGSEAEQEKDQNDQHERHPHQQVVLDGVDGQPNQIAAVVGGVDFDVLWQDVLIEVVCFGLDSFQDVLGLLAGAHQDDAFDGVVVVHEAKFAEARRVAHDDLADVLDAHRHAILAADHGVADVLNVAHEAKPADVIKLSALRIKPSSGVGIVVGKLLDDHGHGEVIAVELRGIEQHLILHHGAAETRIIRDTRNGFIRALDDPVFIRLQFLWSAVGTLQHVAIDQIAWARQWGQRRRDAGRQVDLGEAVEGAFTGEIVICSVVEGHDDVGKPVEGNRTDHAQIRNAVHLDFERNGNQALDFLRRVAGPLRDEFHHRRRKIGVRVPRHALKRNRAANDERDDEKENQKPLAQGELD